MEIGIAYGTEKETWLQNAVRAFADAPEGKNIKIIDTFAAEQYERQRLHMSEMLDGMVKACGPKENSLNSVIKKPRERIRVA